MDGVGGGGGRGRRHVAHPVPALAVPPPSARQPPDPRRPLPFLLAMPTTSLAEESGEGLVGVREADSRDGHDSEGAGCKVAAGRGRRRPPPPRPLRYPPPRPCICPRPSPRPRYSPRPLPLPCRAGMGAARREVWAEARARWRGIGGGRWQGSTVAADSEAAVAVRGKREIFFFEVTKRFKSGRQQLIYNIYIHGFYNSYSFT